MENNDFTRHETKDKAQIVDQQTNYYYFNSLNINVSRKLHYSY